MTILNGLLYVTLHGSEEIVSLRGFSVKDAKWTLIPRQSRNGLSAQAYEMGSGVRSQGASRVVYALLREHHSDKADVPLS